MSYSENRRLINFLQQQSCFASVVSYGLAKVISHRQALSERPVSNYLPLSREHVLPASGPLHRSRSPPIRISSPIPFPVFVSLQYTYLPNSTPVTDSLLSFHRAALCSSSLFVQPWPLSSSFSVLLSRRPANPICYDDRFLADRSSRCLCQVCQCWGKPKQPSPIGALLKVQQTVDADESFQNCANPAPRRRPVL